MKRTQATIPYSSSTTAGEFAELSKVERDSALAGHPAGHGWFNHLCNILANKEADQVRTMARLMVSLDPWALRIVASAAFVTSREKMQAGGVGLSVMTDADNYIEQALKQGRLIDEAVFAIRNCLVGWQNLVRDQRGKGAA